MTDEASIVYFFIVRSQLSFSSELWPWELLAPFCQDVPCLHSVIFHNFFNIDAKKIRLIRRCYFKWLNLFWTIKKWGWPKRLSFLTRALRYWDTGFMLKIVQSDWLLKGMGPFRSQSDLFSLTNFNFCIAKFRYRIFFVRSVRNLICLSILFKYFTESLVYAWTGPR